MANRALGAPRLTGSQPVGKREVAVERSQAEPLAGSYFLHSHAGVRPLRAGPGRPDCLRADHEIQSVLARLRMEVLLPQRMGSSQQSIWRLALRLRYDRFFHPGSRDRRAFGHRRGGVYYRNVAALAARAAGVHYRAAGRDSQRHLRLVGDLRSRAAAANLRAALARPLSWLDRIV